ncbi:DUF2249 domain-containing protein [Micromonospora orduensis]|uniref:DUF2249 domain-containing protein n=1 Tax=Micromonospora orduensis TaxID=1420891 RepID=A0A5C4QSI7_9ACTN|nr:DUF2249 domain-containing protein [Micromonospora orduensis]
MVTSRGKARPVTSSSCPTPGTHSKRLRTALCCSPWPSTTETTTILDTTTSETPRLHGVDRRSRLPGCLDLREIQNPAQSRDVLVSSAATTLSPGDAVVLVVSHAPRPPSPRSRARSGGQIRARSCSPGLRWGRCAWKVWLWSPDPVLLRPDPVSTTNVGLGNKDPVRPDGKRKPWQGCRAGRPEPMATRQLRR